MAGEIIARIRQNDQRAMRQFYQLYVGELTSVCRRYVPDADEAKDVLQNSFVKIFKSLPTVDYSGEKAFRGWLHKIVANESLASPLSAGSTSCYWGRRRSVPAPDPQSRQRLTACDGDA